jgi:hypothetical protein
MDIGVKEIGIGGALMLCLLIIRDVVTSLLKRNGNGKAKSAGELSPDYWDRRFDKLENIVQNTVSIMNDVKQAVQTLIRWKGGD